MLFNALMWPHGTWKKSSWTKQEERRDMSRHDLVSAQNSNVCITHHAALNAIAYILCVKQFVMSLPARLVQCEPKGWNGGRWVGI